VQANPELAQAVLANDIPSLQRILEALRAQQQRRQAEQQRQMVRKHTKSSIRTQCD
jgi:hypothetical protein